MTCCVGPSPFVCVNCCCIVLAILALFCQGSLYTLHNYFGLCWYIFRLTCWINRWYQRSGKVEFDLNVIIFVSTAVFVMCFKLCVGLAGQRNPLCFSSMRVSLGVSCIWASPTRPVSLGMPSVPDSSIGCSLATPMW